VEFFRDTNIDFLGKKWYFLAFSLVFSVAGVCSMLFWHGIPLSVDFRGGTLVYVKFAKTPDEDQLRATLDKAGLHNFRIQQLRSGGTNEELISLDQKETSDQSLDQGKLRIIAALSGNSSKGKPDLNNAGRAVILNALLGADPLHLGTDANVRYGAETDAIINYRNVTKGGVLNGFDELSAATKPEVVTMLKDGFSLSNFGVKNVEIVGPQVGKQLQNQAKLAVLYSLGGMLIYLGFRFELIYGVAAVLGVLTMAIPRRWRAAWVGCWIMVAGRAVCIGGDFTSVGHLIALMLGMLLSAGLLGALTCYSATHL